LEIPDDPRSIGRYRDGMFVIGFDLDVMDLLLMLLEGVDHGLRKLSNSPNPDLTFLTA